MKKGISAGVLETKVLNKPEGLFEPNEKPEATRKGCLSIPEQHELILAFRPRSKRLAHHLLRSWGIELPAGEAESLSDLALCEAAKRFKPSSNVEFVTYFFYFLKGILIRNISKAARDSRHTVSIESLCAKEEDSSRRWEEVVNSSASTNDEGILSRCEPSPEEKTLRSELKLVCDKSLSKLTKLERDVVLRVHVLDTKVAVVARELGYSRGHVSNVRRQAFEKMRPDFENYREAA